MLGCVGIPRNVLLLWEDAVTVWLVQWRSLHPLGGCVGMAGMPYPPMQISTPQHLTTLIRILVINGQEALFAFGRYVVGELQSGVGAVGESQDEDMLVVDVVGGAR